MPHNDDEARATIGKRLRKLRREAGLTGQVLATRAKMSQGKISKIETGRITPAVEDVQRITEAVETPAELQAELVSEARRLTTQLRTWRGPRHEDLTSHQHRIRMLEQEASTISAFHLAIIPGLVQTAEYARQIMRKSHMAHSDHDIASAVAARMNRQTILFELARQFTFVIGEAAFRFPICSRTAMRAQIDRLMTIASLDNIALGILPLDLEIPIPPLNGFVLFDTSAVLVETISAEVILRDERDVDIYVQALDHLKEGARLGSDAARLLQELAISTQQSDSDPTP